MPHQDGNNTADACSKFTERYSVNNKATITRIYEQTSCVIVFFVAFQII